MSTYVLAVQLHLLPMNARDACMKQLSTLVRRYPDLPAGGLSIDDLESAGLQHRDAALAVAIEQTVLRYWSALITIAQAHLTRPWEQTEPGVCAAILTGAAQLLFLDRVPDHAAINESVQWTKQHVRPKAGGLVNAVLRRISEMRMDTVEAFDATSRRQVPLSDGRALLLSKDVFDSDAFTRLAEQTAHPTSLLASWRTQHGTSSAHKLALHSLVHPPIITTGLASTEAQVNECLSPHDESGFFVFTGNRSELHQLLDAIPTARVQDSTSAAPVNATASLQPSLIIDFCAGKGTKTRQLAALHPSSTIVATDVNDERRAVLLRTFADHDQVQVVEPDEVRNWSGRASLVILDVPCSNTGVLPRRVEAKHRATPASRKSLVDLQRQIIADSLPLLADDGFLLYCTCSIEQQENAEQIDWILKWHDFDVSDQCLTLPVGAPGARPTQYRDGGYFALLKR